MKPKLVEGAIRFSVILLSVICVFVSREIRAETIIVDAKVSGKFGGYSGNVQEEGLDLVKAFVFSGPGRITLKAKGRIGLYPGYAQLQGLGPNGKRFRRADPACYLPLEEALVDAEGPGVLEFEMKHIGALFGAFVPQSIVDSPGFRPFNNDLPNGGISSDTLFLVGKSRDFSAEEPGTLFLGVNDVQVQ